MKFFIDKKFFFSFLNVFPPNRDIYNRTLNLLILKSLPSSHEFFVIKFIGLTVVFSLDNTRGTSTVY